MIHLRYLRYILRHKWFVFWAALDMGIPWLGLIHDWSRFRPSEWIAYAESAPFVKEHKPAAIAEAFERAWNDHQHRNKHHWEYYVHFDYHNHKMRCLPMPDRYLREMIADWRGAAKAQQSKLQVWEWFEANQHRMLLHDDTRRQLEDHMRRLFIRHERRLRVRGWLRP